MMRYRIDKTPTAASIELTEVGGTQQQLVEAFRECAEGRCSCPTNEYAKVASMQVDNGVERVAIRLESKPGTEFDTAQIANCLDHTLEAAKGDSSTSEPASETGVR